jgi:signal transduction histidine kinase
LIGFIKDYINEIYLLEDKIIDTEMNFNIEDKFNKEFVREFRPLEITTIIDNLISNAEKADSTLINLSFKKKKENIEFIFQDNGNGISKADLEKVFEMGYTTTNGSGIGLFQVNDLIENSLNGSIEIESEEKKGTAIKITFK